MIKRAAAAVKVRKARLAAYSFGARPQYFFGKNGSRKAVNRGSEMHANFEILNHAPFARLALRFAVPTWAARVHLAARSERCAIRPSEGAVRAVCFPSHRISRSPAVRDGR